MIEIWKNIFGKRYQIKVTSDLEEMVRESVKPYPNHTDNTADVSVFVGCIPDNNERLISQNPAIFSRYERSIFADFGLMKTRWWLSHKLEEPRLIASLTFPDKGSKLLRFLIKARSIEYSTELELFEQLFHELFLIPSIYFFADLVPIHAAAISFNGNGLLLAGTGGTGKTSALLSLRKTEKVSFLSDDIAILSSKGHVYPNFAWPKIYGYNLSGMPELKSQILEGRRLVDRLHFAVRTRINPSKVRRKIRPDELYRDVEREGCQLTSIYYLFRENVSELSVKDLAPELAAEMSIAVMETEYSVFHKFLHWEKYNALGSNYDPLLDINEVMKKWRTTLRAIFEGLPIKLVRIPVSMPHQTYWNEIQAMILNRL
jgi:hypothetical protein